MGDEDAYKKKSEEEEEEEDVDDTQYKHPKDAVLFAIELSDSMLTPPPADPDGHVEDSPMLASLKCAYELLTQRLITNPRDKTGILLYGSAETKLETGNRDAATQAAHPNCYLLVDLNVPSADEVKTIKNLIEEPEEFGKVMRPAKGPLKMADLFFNVNGILTTRAANFASKRLFLITDNDNPHQGNKDEKHKIALEAKDLHGLDVDIELFPVTKPGQNFDYSKIYDSIIWTLAPSDPDAPAPLTQPPGVSKASAGVTLLKSLLSSVLSKAAPKRALFSNLSMELAPDLVISVKGYIIFKRQEKGKSTWVYPGDDRPYLVKPVSTKVAEDSGQAADKDEVRKAYRYGGTQIIFTKEEAAELRNFGDPTIRIVGFKVRDELILPMWANTKHATFLYPSEEAYVGSTRVFAALRQTLKKTNKIGLAWFVARRNAVPVMAAIIPGDKRLYAGGETVVPEGLWLIPLPFADDIRQDPEFKHIPAPDPLIDRMSDIVKALRLPGSQYDPEKYPNPDLQNHFRLLQMVALDESVEGVKVDDQTVPKYRGIERRAGELVQDWQTELEAQAQKWMSEHGHEMVTSAAKRPASAADGGPSKKTKASDMGNDDMEQRFSQGTISQLTVPMLKDFLTAKGLPTSGKKADLVKRIEGHFDDTR